MKRVKMIALGMAVIVGGLTACGSAKEATTCKTAYAENGQIMYMWTGHLTGVSQFSKTTN